VTISKSISIIAPPGIYAGISGSTFNGVTINASAADRVVLRGLTINGAHDGILIEQAGRVEIERCTISRVPTSASG